MNCDLADIILKPYGMESGFIAQGFHEVVVAGSITLEVLIGIVPAVLTPILLHENVLVDLQNVLGQFPRPRLHCVARSEKHVVVNFSVGLKASSLGKYLDGLIVGPFEEEVESLN